MTRWLAVLMLFALAIAPGFWIAQAQDEAETDPGDTPPTLVTVDVGGYEYSLDGDEPLSACVQESRVDFEGTYAQVIVFVRHLDGTIYPLGTYSTRATAGLAGVEVGDCRSLETRE
jgi:hypothetical protein